MAAAVSPTSLFDKLGDAFNQAFEKTKNDEVKLPGGFNTIPANVRGKAQLKTCGLVEIKEGTDKGKIKFMATARVVEPKEYEGEMTSIQEILSETPTKTRKTVEDHWKKVREYLAALGVDLTKLTRANVGGVMADIQKRRPYIRWHTYSMPKQVIVPTGDGRFHLVNEGDTKTVKGPYMTKEIAEKANPYAGKDAMVNHQWDGITKYSVLVNPLADVVDKTIPPVTVPTNGHADDATMLVDFPPTDEGTDDTVNSVADPDVDVAINPDDVDGGDITSVTERAMGGDSIASVSLTLMAKSAGVHANHVAMASNWEAVADMIRSPSEYKTAPQPDLESEWWYYPPNPKTKTKGDKRITVIVQDVSEAKKVCTVVNKDNPKNTFKLVTWGELEFITD